MIEENQNTILLTPGWSVKAVRTGKFKRCTKTVMDTSDPKITFNEAGECQYVEYFETTIRPSWLPNEKGTPETRRDGRTNET